jgi:hypothetical protein
MQYYWQLCSDADDSTSAALSAVRVSEASPRAALTERTSSPREGNDCVLATGVAMNWNNIRAKIATTPARIPVIWFHHRGLHPADAFLASYPRSGNTWLRFVLGEVLTGQSIDFDNMDKFIPWVRFHRQAVPILKAQGRLVKTHERYRPEYKKAIYVVRDVRDVALSTHARFRELKIADPSFDVFLLSFLRGHTNGYGTWSRHVRSWLDGPLAREGKLLVIRFEDLRRSPEEVVGRMLEFLGFEMQVENIRAALANNSIERMRVKEERSKSLFQSATEEGRFVRKGAAEGWRTVLTPAQARLFEQYASRELVRLEYPSA